MIESSTRYIHLVEQAAESIQETGMVDLVILAEADAEGFDALTLTADAHAIADANTST